MNDNNGKPKPVEVTLRDVVHILKTPDLSMPISGVSMTTTHPDGTEDEVVFCDVFTGEDVVTNVLNKLEFPRIEIKRAPRKTVTYYIRELERS